MHPRACHLFDGKLTIAKFIDDSNFDHFGGGYNFGVMTKYKGGLMTVGGDRRRRRRTDPSPLLNTENQKTEILKRDDNRRFSWYVIEPDFEFIQGVSITHHSLVTVASSHTTEEYVLLIGGLGESFTVSKNVFKFNGTWYHFGHLKTARHYHNSIYWNGAVYVIGGNYDCDPQAMSTEPTYVDNCETTKIEIWNIKDSPDQFKTTENWPELFDWESPHLFIVPDSFFPDY